MSKRNEFRFELEKILNIFFLCKESYLVLRELNRVENNSEYKINLKFKNSFFTLTKVNYWRIVVLQLAKLYNNNERERFNLNRLLVKCKKNNYFSSLNISSIFIDKELKKISDKAIIISQIKLQRDKIIAHEDSSRDEIVNDVTLDEAKELIDLCQNIIFEIYREIFDTHYEFEMGNSPEWSLKNILNDLDTIMSHKKEERKNILKILNRDKI